VADPSETLRGDLADSERAGQELSSMTGGFTSINPLEGIFQTGFFTEATSGGGEVSGSGAASMKYRRRQKQRSRETERRLYRG
jgi:hypothetical protein